MNSLADIKRRIASVKQTRQITGAMETISIAKMRKSTELYEQNREYFDIIKRVMSCAVSRMDKTSDALIDPEPGKKLLIVISSDKGLCGGFNHDVLKAAQAEVDGDTVVFPIGQTALDFFAGTAETDGSFLSYSGTPDYAYAKLMAEKVIDVYGKDFSSVSIVYSKLIGRSGWEPTIERLLPISKDMTDDGEFVGTEFEPSPSEVMKRLMPLYLTGAIYGAIINSVTSEHIARRTAMSASTKNADELISSLSIEYNRARQGQVTEQITEIIGSTKALGRRGGGDE